MSKETKSEKLGAPWHPDTVLAMDNALEGVSADSEGLTSTAEEVLDAFEFALNDKGLSLRVTERDPLDERLIT